MAAHPDWNPGGWDALNAKTKRAAIKAGEAPPRSEGTWRDERAGDGSNRSRQARGCGEAALRAKRRRRVGRGAPFRHDERRDTSSRGRIGIGRRTDAVDEPQREGQRRRDRPVGHEQLAIEAPEGVAIASDRRARGSPARGIPNEIQPEQQVHPVATAIQFLTAVASLPDLWSGSTLALQTKRTTTPCRAPRTRS